MMNESLEVLGEEWTCEKENATTDNVSQEETCTEVGHV